MVPPPISPSPSCGTSSSINFVYDSLGQGVNAPCQTSQHYYGYKAPGPNGHSCYDADDPTKHLLAHVATTAFDSDQEGDAPKCHPSTRLEVLNEIMTWITQAFITTQFILWLNGAAGAGKSAIARSVVELCAQNSIILAKFFFFRTDPTRNNVGPLAATLAYQLIQCLPDLEPIIIPRIQSDPLIFNKSMDTQFQYLIFEPLSQLERESQCQKTVLLLIDGVDECSGHNTQTNLIHIVARCVETQAFPLIALFGSRAEAQLQQAFRSPLVHKHMRQLPLDHHYLPDKDIRLFLSESFSTIKKTHVFGGVLGPEWPPPASVEEIVTKSSGQFIYASAVVKFISASRTHPGQQLDIIRGLRPAGRATPFAQLDALYHHIFSQVQDIDRTILLLAARVLTNAELWKCQTMANLSRCEANVALMDLTSVVRISGSYDSAVDSILKASEIQFLHASLPDFLLDKHRSQKYCVDTPEIKAQLCNNLLRYEIYQQNKSWSYIDVYRSYLVALLPGAACIPTLKETILEFRPIDTNVGFWKTHYLPVVQKMDFRDKGKTYRQQAAVIMSVENETMRFKARAKAVLRDIFML